jgi:hypothetical protein
MFFSLEEIALSLYVILITITINYNYLIEHSPQIKQGNVTINCVLGRTKE